MEASRRSPRGPRPAGLATLLIGACGLPLLPLTSLAAPLPLASPDGMALLSSSTARADYGSLAQEFLTQANLAYCGVASSVMVLNSLLVPAPTVQGYGSYRFWTQENLWSGLQANTPEAAAPRSKPVVSPEQVQRQGMTLDELATLLRSHGLKVRAIHGSELDEIAFRNQLRRSLNDPGDRLLINYDRRLVGQTGGGHISPLAAYHAGRDQVLILDVARYRYPAVWVPLQDLWQAIRGVDTSSGLSRGIVMVRR